MSEDYVTLIKAYNGAGKELGQFIFKDIGEFIDALKKIGPQEYKCGCFACIGMMPGYCDGKPLKAEG